MKKKIEKKLWDDFCNKNNTSSYSLIVAVAVLMIWEDNCKTEDEAHQTLIKAGFGLTGAQASMALSLALAGKPDKWLDVTNIVK